MDGQRFDQLVRSFAASAPRRRVLAGLAVSALAALAPRRAAAACTPETCDETFDCGERVCVTQCETIFEPAGTVCRPAANECDVEEVCNGHSLNCPADRKKPNGTRCTDDGNPCTDNICQNGECVAVNNTATCADDGNPCTDDICSGGTCTHPTKPDGTTCAPGKVCQAGSCECAPGSDTCGEVCTDLQSDPDNCGACDHACASGRSCCKGKCVKLSSDTHNCGRCGKRCGHGQKCRGGRCHKGGHRSAGGKMQ